MFIIFISISNFRLNGHNFSRVNQIQFGPQIWTSGNIVKAMARSKTLLREDNGKTQEEDDTQDAG